MVVHAVCLIKLWVCLLLCWSVWSAVGSHVAGDHGVFGTFKHFETEKFDYAPLLPLPTSPTFYLNNPCPKSSFSWQRALSCWGVDTVLLVYKPKNSHTKYSFAIHDAKRAINMCQRVDIGGEWYTLNASETVRFAALRSAIEQQKSFRYETFTAPELDSLVLNFVAAVQKNGVGEGSRKFLQYEKELLPEGFTREWSVEFFCPDRQVSTPQGCLSLCLGSRALRGTLIAKGAKSNALESEYTRFCRFMRQISKADQDV